MQRYSVITKKLPREIVLLKGLPCIWSKCTFCDYIDDNTTDEAAIERVAESELAKVTGRFGRLEVINSGSIQELTPAVRERIRDLIERLSIKDFICESYWAYRKRWDETRAFFGPGTRIKLGVETFDDHVRNVVLNKAMPFESPEEVARLTDTICPDGRRSRPDAGLRASGHRHPARALPLRMRELVHAEHEKRGAAR